MIRGSFKSVLAIVVVALLAMTGSLAYGQGGATTSSLTGVVTDSTGGVIPGADVVAKNNATAGEFRAVTDSTGTFTLPSLPPGGYTVTIALMGFKTLVLPDVQLVAAQPARLSRLILDVGQLQETVTVTGATEIVQAESSAVATTLSTKQITSVPLPTRNTLDFVASLPGVNTTGSIRNSTVMGLQASATNITIDGINVQDNYLKSSDGFFARISPRMDAVEEVTVSTANPGAESAGQGAVQIRFVTRSGTNKFQGSAYEYMRRPSFNSNYWFNIQQSLAKEKVKLDTYGGRLGGPILKDKLFFFFNYEEIRQPGTQTRSRTMLTAAASAGTFQWNNTTTPAGTYLNGVLNSNGNVTCTGATCSIDLLAFAGLNGQLNTTDPLTANVLAALQTAAGQGTLTQVPGSPNLQQLNFANAYSSIRRYPTTRIDYNITSKHRVGVSYYFQQYLTTPDTLNTYDPRFPGFPVGAGQNSNRWSWMMNWRWTVSPNMVNEVRGGLTGGPIKFGDGISRDAYQASGSPFADWQGWVPYPSTALISQMYTGRSGSSRDAPTQVLEDTFSWLRGKHSINVGASFTNVALSYYNVQNYVPYLSFGLDSSEAAYSMFSGGTTGALVGASSTDLTNARNLYGFMTGRINAIYQTQYLSPSGDYVNLGDAYQQAHERELGFYAQDSWKARPDLTISYGIRYELQMPFIMDNAYFSRPLTYCNSYGVSGCAADGVSANLNAPGSLNGTISQLRAFLPSEAAYNTPKKNWAPSLGVAWRPHIASNGWLQKILSADPVLRAGYSKAFTREGIYAVTALYGANPGGSYDTSRTMSAGNLIPTGGALPILLRNGFSQFTPATYSVSGGTQIPVPSSPAYPLTATTASSINEFYPNSQTPWAHTFNVSFQRTLGKNTAVDIRYVGTRNYGGWWIGGRNMNEANTIENGFLSEFKLAQANLAANIAAANGKGYAYTGIAGTSPLPIMLAWMTGSTASTVPANYSATYFGPNTSGASYLVKTNPAPQSFASYLQTYSSAFATNARNTGYPANFFMVNPGVSSGGAWITGRPEDSYNNKYDALQIELRRRMSGGLLVQGSYQYVIRSLSNGSYFYTVRVPGAYGNTATPKHSLKINWAYELPFGQGKPVLGGVGRLGQMLVGGWSLDGNLRAQSGNILDFGNVRLVGMTDQQLQDEFYLRFVKDNAGVTHVYDLPDDIIQNTIRAYSTLASSATGYSGAAPTGRYFEPVNAADPIGNPTGCISGYATQCTGDTPLHHYVTGPAFFRLDIGLGKRIDITKRVWGDFRVDILNVLNNIDYFGQTWTGTAPTTTAAYEVTTAYRDSSNTQDPGGRIMQLSFRVTF
jgi:hypothetical protein